MISAVAPVFALILLGFGLRRLGFPGDDFWPHCERLVYYLLFPALLVTRLAVVPLQAEPLADLALALVLPTLAVSAGLLLLRPLAGLSAAGFTSVFQGGIRFNTYIALALGAALDPARGLELTALAAAMLIPLVNLLCVSVLVLFGRDSRAGWPGLLLRGLARNPLILACLAGLAINALGLALPAVATDTAGLLGQTALPLGLLAVGAGLTLGSVPGPAHGPGPFQHRQASGVAAAGLGPVPVGGGDCRRSRASRSCSRPCPPLARPISWLARWAATTRAWPPSSPCRPCSPCSACPGWWRSRAEAMRPSWRPLAGLLAADPAGGRRLAAVAAAGAGAAGTDGTGTRGPAAPGHGAPGAGLGAAPAGGGEHRGPAARLEQAAPRRLSGREENPLGALSDDRLDWQAERGPIALAGRPDGLYLQVAAVGQARVQGNARILVEIPVSARADLAATLTARLQPRLRPDWTLAPNLVGVVQVQRAEVPIQGLGRVSLREQVQGPANRAAQGLLRRLEQRLAEDDQLRSMAEREWARLHQVQRVSEDPPAWLVMWPTGVRAQQPRIDHESLHLGLGISAQTRLVAVVEPPANPVAPLPPLELGPIQPGVWDFQVLGSLSWAEANRLLAERLVGRDYRLEQGLEVYLAAAEVRPWGEQLLLVLDLEARHSLFARTKARIYLKARPELDAEAGRLRLRELDFSTETRDSFLSSAAWLLRPALLEAIRARAEIDLSEPAAEARAAANRALADWIAGMPAGVKLQGQVEEVTLEQVALGAEHLHLVAVIRGRLEAAVSRLDF